MAVRDKIAARPTTPPHSVRTVWARWSAAHLHERLQRVLLIRPRRWELSAVHLVQRRPHVGRVWKVLRAEVPRVVRCGRHHRRRRGADVPCHAGEEHIECQLVPNGRKGRERKRWGRRPGGRKCDGADTGKASDGGFCFSEASLGGGEEFRRASEPLSCHEFFFSDNLTRGVITMSFGVYSYIYIYIYIHIDMCTSMK